jgi:BCD family chlorophyll transporter-like MFS transporter
MNSTGLGWGNIIRLGLVQSGLGAIVMLATSLLNRIMVVEFALPALIPAGLVAWHYAVQLSRPRWGHGSDIGNRRTPWIIIGMGVLALGGLLATYATLLMPGSPIMGGTLAVIAYTMIGAGVGASGTSLLALLATQVAPARRPAAAATTWVMMILGIIVTAGVAGQLLDPFSPQRLANVAGGVVLFAFLMTVAAVYGVEQESPPLPRPEARITTSFTDTIASVWADPAARHFSIFIFVSMFAYSTQDMILEPMAGLVFGYTPGQSTSLSGTQHMGVLLGMILVGVGGGAFRGKSDLAMRRWIVGGCIGSGVALIGLCAAVLAGPGWPLSATVFTLGFANGVFAVAAIAAMMDLAGAGGSGREGIRMGLWGAAQAIAFGMGGFTGAAGLDAARALLPSTADAFVLVFAGEAILFVVAAVLALRIGTRPTHSAGSATLATGVTG